MIGVGTKFRIIPGKGHFWYEEFHDKILEVCEGYDPDHDQLPTMTDDGRTWFNCDAVEILED